MLGHMFMTASTSLGVQYSRVIGAVFWTSGVWVIPMFKIIV